MTGLMPIAESKKDTKTTGDNSESIRVGTNIDEEGRLNIDLSQECMNLICNPAFAALRRTLDELKANPCGELVDEVHLIMLVDNSQKNVLILDILPEIYPYIAYPALYDKICLLLADVAHLNSTVISSLLAFDIFSYLDYSKNITFGLILSICDNNKEAWDLFRAQHYKEEYGSNDKIQMLENQYKQ
ncbi:hypothetical protein ENBRE01_1628 [Enteropsectra breve]|nr:hypothetical protein ENBRE01_1628 [Enteropsectra breve]